MPLRNRDLSAGTRLVATYKKHTYVCTVKEHNEFALEDGRRFKSPSAAGSAIMEGKAVNGWRFWSLEAEPPPSSEGLQRQSGAKKPRRIIYRVPNQHGTPEGKVKFFCSACMNGFLINKGDNPQACLAGHRIDVADQASGTEASS